MAWRCVQWLWWGVAAAAVAACSSAPPVGGTANAPFPFVFSGQSGYAPVSGAQATAVVLDPGSEDLAVERLGWRRIGPDSCFVQFFKRAPNAPAREDTDVADKCEDRSPQSRYLTAGYDNGHSSGSLTFMTALRLCVDKNSGRMAGIEMVLKQFDLDGRSALRTDLPADQYTANMEDCELAPWSECPAGQAMNGVRLHYGRIGGKLNIVGLQARCRPFIGPNL